MSRPTTWRGRSTLIVSSLSIQQPLGQIPADRKVVYKEEETMSTPSRNDAVVSAQTSALTGSPWRGLLIGLIPLGLLIVMVTITIALTALARQLFVGSGFFAQQ